MKTIKEAQAKGFRVYRQVRYYATKDEMTYELMPEAKYEYVYNWRKYPGKKKKK